MDVAAGLPVAAAWRHAEVRDGVESAFLFTRARGPHAVGTTTAVQAGRPWTVRYDIELTQRWITTYARVTGVSSRGDFTTRLTSAGDGLWTVNGKRTPQLDGCLDVDLESSVLTNAFPVLRLRLAVGDDADVPAAFVSAETLEVRRIEQHYVRLPDGPAGPRYRYASPTFDFDCELRYDWAGLLLDYPGIASRLAAA